MDKNKVNQKIYDKLEKFLKTYPEGLRYKVSPGNVLLLMQWSYDLAKEEMENGKK
jgi:hypothetical protein